MAVYDFTDSGVTFIFPHSRLVYVSDQSVKKRYFTELSFCSIFLYRRYCRNKVKGTYILNIVIVCQ